MLFDPIERTDDSPKLARETDFSFLNRSSRNEFSNVRFFLEELAAVYPEKDELRSRIRSGDNSHFRSATFELLLFGMLKSRGFDLTPHPSLENGNSARPDFLVQGPDGVEFYLEAVLASEQSGDPTDKPLIAALIDSLSKESHPHFSVVVSTAGYPISQPSGQKLVKKVLKWLDSLDVASFREPLVASGIDYAPTMRWAHEGLEITLRAVPHSEQRRNRPHGLVSAIFGQGGWVNAWSPIRDAIAFKSRKYGDLKKPLVIAVNFWGHHLDPIDEVQALFGQEQFVVSLTDSEAAPRMSRAPNGAWRQKKGPSGRRTSAAWLFDNFSSHSVPRSRATLYLHPDPLVPIAGDLLSFCHATVEDDSIVYKDGLTPNLAFNLPTDWPSVRRS